MAKGALRALCVAALGAVFVPVAHAASPIGTWTPVAPMSTARFAAASAELSDGRVLVAGGQSSSGEIFNSAELYDPTTDTWSHAAPMSTPRMYAAAAALPDDRVLVAGGADALGHITATAEIYDAHSDSWSALPSMLSARAAGAAVFAPATGDVEVLGGTGPSGLGTVPTEVLNPSQTAWTEQPTTDTVTGAATAIANDGEVFRAGGLSHEGGTIATGSMGQPESAPFGFVPPMTAQRFLATAAALRSSWMLVAGGQENTVTLGGVLASAEIYDSDVQQWFAAAPMSTPRFGAISAPLPGGRVLVAGGAHWQPGATAEVSESLASAEVFSAPRLAAPPLGVSLSESTQSGVYDGSQGTRVGDTIFATGWSGGPDSTITSYQWQRCRQVCENVGTADTGSVGSSYTITSADVSASIRVLVTARNADATASTTSASVGPIQPPGFHLPTSNLPFWLFRPTSDLRIPVYRDDAGDAGQVSYRVTDPTADPTFAPMEGTLSFPAGAHQEAIDVPIEDHGVPILAPELQVVLVGGSPDPVVSPASLSLPISGLDPSAYVRDRLNPLRLPAPPRPTNPLAGAAFFVDFTGTPVAKQTAAWRLTQPAKAALLYQIVEQPNTERYGKWSGPYPGSRVAKYLRRVDEQHPGSVPLLATYKIVSGHCGGWSDSPADAAAYHAWITSLAEGIGTHPAVLFLEMDSIITAPQCLSRHGITVRMNELHDAINVLSNCPHLVTYLDAGAADALKPQVAARLLERAGVGQIQGFFLNSTHFDWTKNEIRYGEKISKLTGGKHFVVNTAENGQGPERTEHPATEGAEVICNPKNRGLGPKPTTRTGYPNVDAFAWIAHPGVSGGPCTKGAPPIGDFWPAQALSLVRHADYALR